MNTYKGKLHETVSKFPNLEVWNDSCSYSELCYAIDRGAVSATTNPVIVSSVLKKEFKDWVFKIKELISENPDATEDDIAWLLIDQMGLLGAKTLEPIWQKSGGKQGKISMQTNAKYYRNASKMIDQTCHFNSLAPNIQVKIPASFAGVKAIEEVTYLGISINATVSFTVSQALAVAEAVERGLERRKAEGKSVEGITPVCTLMIGRVDDWLKTITDEQNILVDGGVIDWAGVAVFKKAYALYQEKAYTTRLLTAAYRNHYHWSQLIGPNVCMTIPYNWQVKLNNCSVPVKETLHLPVDANILEQLNTIPDFKDFYEPSALTPEQFDTFGSFKVTLNQFLKGYDELISQIRCVMVD
ncbi:MAG: transaldolase [Clostridia bacterium]|jgi:transaldolase|nr:transaldolase [Clostridia bacterium]